MLKRFLLLSKTVPTKTCDDDLKSYAAKETQDLINHLHEQGFDQTMIDALDHETTATIDFRATQSRHLKRLEWLQRSLAGARTCLEVLVEGVKNTLDNSGTMEEDHESQIAREKLCSSELGMLARTWQDMVDKDVFAENHAE